MKDIKSDCIQNIPAELDGIAAEIVSLSLLISAEEGSIDRPTGQTFHEALFAISKHLERISSDLSDVI